MHRTSRFLRTFCGGVLLSLPLSTAYEVAFYTSRLPFSEVTHPTSFINYQMYPRFTCNEIPAEDLEVGVFEEERGEGEGEEHPFTNILVRTASDAVGPPKLLLLYRAPEDMHRGIAPCAFRNGVAAVYWFGEKPSVQVISVQANIRATHFKEINERMPEWTRLVRGFEMRRGQNLEKVGADGEWEIGEERVEVLDFDVSSDEEDYEDGDVIIEGQEEEEVDQVPASWRVASTIAGSDFAPEEELGFDQLRRMGYSIDDTWEERRARELEVRNGLIGDIERAAGGSDWLDRMFSVQQEPAMDPVSLLDIQVDEAVALNVNNGIIDINENFPSG
ncbi:hypothetical protein ABW20_dc0104250 [Dactylellina cionopaga]|nr:hypothetical protein ABW20_dc0104250 [Dactylellina cionopaga]